MIDWIKFSERQPEKEDQYLCLPDSGYGLCVATWREGREGTWFYVDKNPLGQWSKLKGPLWWATVNSPPCRTKLDYKGHFVAFVTDDSPSSKETPMPEVKLCKDCRFFNPKGVKFNHIHDFSRCEHLSSLTSVVDGSSMETCNSSRRQKDLCGPEGKWWEAKNLQTKVRPNMTIGLNAEERADYLDVLDKIRRWFQ
jgi:hypothetical protein